MNRTVLIRSLIVIAVIVAAVAFAGGDSSVDPDANVLLPLLALFTASRYTSKP